VKVLIATHHYFDLTGSETFAYTLAKTLMFKGCNVAIYSPYIGGVITEKTLQLGIPVFSSLQVVKEEKFDVIHLSHNLVAIEVRYCFPYTPIIFLSHGVLPFLEQPPLEDLNISKFLAVSEEVKDNLVEKGIPNDKIMIFRNMIDTKRFYPFEEINEEPKRVLVNSRRMDQQTKSIVAEACKRLSLEMKFIGNPGNIEWDVEKHINQVDICISLGRGILEAMSCGRAAIVYDYDGGDGLVTVDNIEEIQKCNFSGRRFKRKFSVETLIDEIQKYTKHMGMANRGIVEERFSAEKNVNLLIDIYEKAINFFEHKPPMFDRLNHLKNLITETRSYSFEAERRRFDGVLRDKESALREKDRDIGSLNETVSQKDSKISELTGALSERDGVIEGLNESFRQRDIDISHLEDVVREKEAEAEGLRAGLVEKERGLGSLNEAVSRKDSKISELSGILSERDEVIEGLNESFRQRDAHISHLEGVVREKEAEAEGLKAGLVEKEREIGSLNETINQKATQISHLEGVAWEKEAKLNHIYNSHGWKALLIYYRMRERILPINTKRRLSAKILFKLITNPKGIFKNLSKINIKKFAHYFRKAEPANIEQKIEKNVSDVSVVGESSAVSEPPPFKMEFERNISEEGIEDLNFPYYNEPLVSIIIPVRDNWRYTYACLKSILQNTKEVPFEVIIVNDQSTDETPEMLRRMSGIQIINNPINLGWVKNCNNAADQAKGKYILLLNNDTEVMEGWLANLVEIAEGDDKVGVVGGKILYPDGRLQEAGSVMDREGWGQLYGRFGDPDRYEYNYVKETDFITGVCLLIRKDVFLKLGGFDERYAPAFYEEFDLEFAIREAGYKIMYQPRAVIVHHQTSSYGPEIRDSLSSCNHAKFIEKWANQISEHTEQSDIFLARDRSKNRKVILLIDEKIPDYDKNAGSLTTYQYIRLFQEIGFKVIFIPDLLLPLEPYTTELQQMGIEVVYGQFDFESWIRHNGSHIHYVWLSRPQIGVKYIEAIKQHSRAKICYYTHDLHYLRELRRYEIEKKKEILDESNWLKKIEFYLFENVDVILTPSDYEQKVIKEIFVDKHVVTIPAYYYDVDSVDKTISGNFEGRSGLIFLGGFGHLPNVDAINWFVNEIYPAVKREVPEIKFYIVGSDPPPEITALSRSDIIVTGYVRDLVPLFQKCRVFVCPLRYGAGVKGKTVMSMYYGVPVISTKIGNEGLNLEHCAEAFIADDPIEFAKWTVELYTNPKIWTKFSENSIRFVKNNFSKDKAKYVILETLQNK
jgi:GT2 family glycosyltransferase